ncbi:MULTISPECIES: acyltransferase family protein [unclassified Sphingobium]|uniref:acyltransferase family protein n=1 Tax=unclassified Sphingobium TaxID=2611147 RepID=UPI00076FE1AB|nr:MULTISPECIES: acyltransferase family protein [unclassified Sphingobium]AMK22657.1 putative acetyltransferase [Sphingobium sp. TKS]NML90174.1 acyltransferase family protein [Sphingobium sp. TB-6]
MENRGHEAHPPGGGRLEWIDVARGIGIVAVVVGHVWTRGALRDAMYSFHMPLFFLLSGLLSRPQPVTRFTWRQLASQMRPYAAFLILLILADQIIERMKGGRPIFHSWPQDVAPVLLGGSWLRGPFTIFWFVPCLMMARILFNMALARWPDPLDRRWTLLMLPCLLLAYGVGKFTSLSPLGLLTVPMALVLLWLGAVWRLVTWRGWMLAPLIPLSLAGLMALLPTLNMKAADYGWPLLSVGSAVATSFLLFRLSVRIAPFGGWIAAIGRASLVIMYLHVAVIHYLSPYLSKPWLLMQALLLPIAAYYLIRAVPGARRIFL